MRNKHGHFGRRSLILQIDRRGPFLLLPARLNTLGNSARALEFARKALDLNPQFDLYESAQARALVDVLT